MKSFPPLFSTSFEALSERSFSCSIWMNEKLAFWCNLDRSVRNIFHKTLIKLSSLLSYSEQFFHHAAHFLSIQDPNLPIHCFIFDLYFASVNHPPFWMECKMIINRVRDAILGAFGLAINLLGSSSSQRIYRPKQTSLTHSPHRSYARWWIICWDEHRTSQ